MKLAYLGKIGVLQLILLGVLAAVGALWPNIFSPLYAQTGGCIKTITVIARDTDGNFIPDISFSFYEQVTDVDGKPKPGKLLVSGKTDAILGKGVVTFQTGGTEYYVLKMYSINKSFTQFYYYNEPRVECNESIEVTKVLSAIKFTFRNTNGNLVRNRKFSLYTQKKDADGEPIKEKEDLVGAFDSSGEGTTKIYLPSDDQSIDGKTGGIFVFESGDTKTGISLQYDIYASPEHTLKVNYVFSDMELIFRDANNVFFPANTKVNIYKQKETGANNEEKMGTLVATLDTNDKGTAVLEYPAGRYMARIMGADKQYIYFLDLYIVDQKRKTYELTTAENQNPESGACDAASTFTLITKNYQDALIADLSYELYEQLEDANGKPAAGVKVKSGKTDTNGRAAVVFNPDPRKTYALKIYDKNAKAGDYWFFNEIRFVCGRDKEIIKKLPAIRVILRDGNGSLRKNQKFSVYTQRFDVDGGAIKEKEDLISAAFTTSEEGEAIVYAAPAHPYNKNKRGTYILSVSGANKNEYNEYGIIMPAYQDVYLDYTLSDIIVKLKNSVGKNLSGKTISLYEQTRTPSGGRALGKLLGSAKTNSEGEAGFAYPAAVYALMVPDDIKQNNIFWDIEIKSRQRNSKTITPNLTRIKVQDGAGKLKPVNTAITIYALNKDENGAYYKGKKLPATKTGELGYAEISLSPGPYLFTVNHNKVDYGEALYVANDLLQNLVIAALAGKEIRSGQKFTVTAPAGNNSSNDKLRGRILLQIEGHGEAWYVSPNDGKRFYMSNGTVAYEMMRRFGLGITNANLVKIPIGLDKRFNEADTDGDGVPDKMEEALGIDSAKTDSDDDGYDDYAEIMNGYNPGGGGQWPQDFGLSEKLKGRIVLQVEGRGEAWYINPDDGRRYYMKDGGSAYEIMRFLSLGITNENLNKIEEGKLD